MFPRFVTSFFDLSNRILLREKSSLVSSEMHAPSSEVDSIQFEFQAIASILRFAFEKMSSLGQNFDVVLRQLAVSLVAHIPLQSADDANCQLQRILEWRHALLVTRKHVVSPCQSKTFESSHPYSDSFDESHSIQFSGVWYVYGMCMCMGMIMGMVWVWVRV